MKTNVRNAALVGAIAAVAATAWAANDFRGNSSYVPSYSVERSAATTSEAIPLEESLAPNESVVTSTTAYTSREVTPILRTDTTIDNPPVIVEERRLSRDERIQLEVMDRLAANRNISGKIGVESYDSVVRLSGWTATAGQARRAEHDARSVDGVSYVQNEIRPRIGGSV